MGFEKRRNLKRTAKNILQKNGSDSNDAEKFAESIVYDFVEDSKSGLTILKATSQISFDNNLKDTLNYLRAHANDRRKKEYILGELWQALSDKKESYNNELSDFIVDFNSKNIFAA
jgi:hypothetical protein